jgi:CBS domain-containing protein
MLVKQLMTREVHTCSPEDTLQKAVEIFRENECGCLPIVDQDGRVIGIFTDRDALMVAYTQGKRLDAISVLNAIAREVQCCRPDDTVATAESLMKQKKIRRGALSPAGATGASLQPWKSTRKGVVG